MKFFLEAVGNRIHARRTELGWGRDKLAHEMTCWKEKIPFYNMNTGKKVAGSSITDYENGKTELSGKTFILLTYALNIQPQCLFPFQMNNGSLYRTNISDSFQNLDVKQNAEQIIKFEGTYAKFSLRFQSFDEKLQQYIKDPDHTIQMTDSVFSRWKHRKSVPDLFTLQLIYLADENFFRQMITPLSVLRQNEPEKLR